MERIEEREQRLQRRLLFKKWKASFLLIDAHFAFDCQAFSLLSNQRLHLGSARLHAYASFCIDDDILYVHEKC